MVDQFEAEKCIQAASTDNLVLMIIDNKSNPRAAPRATPRQFRWYKFQDRVEGRCKTLGVARGGGGDVGAWN